MKILNFSQLPNTEFTQTAVTIGNFDGVHLGHQRLITNTVHSAKQHGLKSIIITFNPHPAAYFSPQHTPPAICSHSFKEKLIANLGADALLTLTFDKSLASLDAEDYISEVLLKKLHARVVWIGYDFTFGKDRRGNPRLFMELAEKLQFTSYVLSPQLIDDSIISSTRIRECLMNGEIETANAMLNRCHLIRGHVTPGDKVGRNLGFPTINISIEDGLIPAPGIYSGLANTAAGIFPAAIYIGYRPTFGKPNLRIEAHLLGFDGDLYSKIASLAFLRRIREDTKFTSTDELKENIRSDCDTTATDVDLFYKNQSGIPVIW